MDDMSEKTGNADLAGFGGLLDEIKKRLLLQVAVIFVGCTGFEPSCLADIILICPLLKSVGPRLPALAAVCLLGSSLFGLMGSGGLRNKCGP
jgi:hypothetical protein